MQGLLGHAMSEFVENMQAMELERGTFADSSMKRERVVFVEKNWETMWEYDDRWRVLRLEWHNVSSNRSMAKMDLKLCASYIHSSSRNPWCHRNRSWLILPPW